MTPFWWQGAKIYPFGASATLGRLCIHRSLSEPVPMLSKPRHRLLSLPDMEGQCPQHDIGNGVEEGKQRVLGNYQLGNVSPSAVSPGGLLP
jgi:hypothetical protein